MATTSTKKKASNAKYRITGALKAKQLFYHDEEINRWVTKLCVASNAPLSNDPKAWMDPLNIMAMKALGIPESAYQLVYENASGQMTAV